MNASLRRVLMVVVVVCGAFDATWLATAAILNAPAEVAPQPGEVVPSNSPPGPPRAGSASRLVSEQSDHDFGVILQGRKADHVFLLQNRGDLPSRIAEVKASCGCTATDLSTSVVPTGGTARLKVTFSAGGARGRFRKTVQVFSDDPDSPLTLKVSGTVTPLFRVEPELVLFGRVVPGQAERRSARIVAAGPEVPMAPRLPRVADLALRVEGLRAVGPGAWVVDLVACPQAGTDLLDGAVLVPTGNGEAPFASIRVSGDVGAAP